MQGRRKTSDSWTRGLPSSGFGTTPKRLEEIRQKLPWEVCFALNLGTPDRKLTTSAGFSGESVGAGLLFFYSQY